VKISAVIGLLPSPLRGSDLLNAMAKPPLKTPALPFFLFPLLHRFLTLWERRRKTLKTGFDVRGLPLPGKLSFSLFSFLFSISPGNRRELCGTGSTSLFLFPFPPLLLRNRAPSAPST